MNFFRISELPAHSAGEITDYPGEWDDKQALAANPIRFTPATGPYSGRDMIFMYYRGANDLLSTTGIVQIGVMTADAISFDGRNWDKHRDINPIIPAETVSFPDISTTVTTPIVVVMSGQSNARGASTGGTFGSSSLVSAWLSTSSGGAGAWVVNPNFSTTTYYVPGTTVSLGGGSNNAGLQFCHRIAAETGRQVRFVIEALDGQSIDQWVAAGTSSARYLALKARTVEALSSLGKSSIDIFLWQQGEADSGLSASAYETKLTTLFNQLRGESWWRRSATPANSDTISILGQPIPDLSAYDELRAAQELYVQGEDRRVRIAYADDLVQAGDDLNFTGVSLRTLGYERYADAYSLSLANSSPVLDGDYNDMTVVEYDGKIRLFVNVYGNPTNSNRMVVYESLDGLNFTYLQEVLYSGGYFGCTCGPIWNVAGTIWGLFSIATLSGGGNEKRLRGSVDGGLTWTDYGRAISVSNVDGQWDSHSLVVGRGFQDEDYVYAVISAMRFIGNDGSGSPYKDWPEAAGIWRLAKDQLGINDLQWTKYPRNPVMLRGPVEGGIWQLAPIDLGGTRLGTYQTWAVPGYENIDSANVQTLRAVPYSGLSAGWSTKHIYSLVAGNLLALTNWNYDPFPDGRYALKHIATGQYLCSGTSGLYMSETDAFATFDLTRQLDFYKLSIDGDCLRTTSNANQSGVAMSPDPGATSNFAGQWLLEIVDDAPISMPQAVVLTNRLSSLSLGVRRSHDFNGTGLETRPFLYPDPDMIWEVVPVYAEGTETIDPDTGTPVSLPSGDLVGTTGIQTLTNKALEVLPRTSFVTRNAAGAFSALADGLKVLTDSGIFTKTASATYVTDLTGWNPWVGYRIVNASQFFADDDSPDDQAAKFQAMVDWASGLNRPVVLDCSGMTFRFGVGIVPQGATDVQILHGTYKPHENWTSQAHWSGGPPTKIVWNSKTTEPDADAKAVNALFDLSPGVGRIQLYGCTFDGRPDSGTYDGVAVADHVAMRAGTNNVIWCDGRYYYDYGIWNSGGNAQKISYCTFEQWKFNDAENQVQANRTGAAYVIASGDCEVEFCLGGYTAYPLVAIGTVGHMRLNHFYNGLPDYATGDVTTNRQYCVLARSSAGLSMRNCQLDKGGLHIQGKASLTFSACEVHIDDNYGGQDLRFAVFEATEPNQKMRGMVIADTLIIGRDGEADVPLTSDRFFLDISSGGNSYAVDDSPNVTVEGLTYRAGSHVVDQIPQMRGTRQYELRADAWTWDSGHGAYKTDLIDVSPSMFMPSLFPTEVVKWVLADVKDAGVSKPVGAIWATRTSTGVYLLWHNFAAVPTRMIFEASWDYRDTRKVTVGSNATVGSTHTQMIYSHGAAWSDVTGKPTTLSGYGITDAVGLSGDQTIAGVKTFSSAPVLAALASDPASPVNGQVWHRIDTGHIRAQVNGSVQNLDGQMDVPFLVPPAGEFIMTTTGATNGGTNTLAGVADRIDIFPFSPRADLAIDQLVVNVTTGVASATGKIVLYTADANGRPAALVSESGALDFSTTGAKAWSYTTTLRQGTTYWLGIRHSSTATLSTWTASATPDINGGTAIATTARKVLRRTSVTYASAAPANWVFDGTEITNSSATAIWLRKA